MAPYSLLPTDVGVAPAWRLLTVVPTCLVGHRCKLSYGSSALVLNCLGSGVVGFVDVGYGRLLLSVLITSSWLFPAHLASFLVSVQDPHC